MNIQQKKAINQKLSKMAGTMENTQNTRKNKHLTNKLGELVNEMNIRAEAHLYRKVEWKLFVRFKPGQTREKYSWVDWWLVEDYINRGLLEAFKRKSVKCMRLESLYLKMQECAPNAEQIIIYDKRENKHKYEEDQKLIEIVKGRVRLDKRPDSEKQLWPIKELIN
jgi:hypothetical protein